MSTRKEVEIIADDVVIISGSGLSSAIDGTYEACSFGGHPHRNCRWYAVRSFDALLVILFQLF